jgi:hypothetical protein
MAKKIITDWEKEQSARWELRAKRRERNEVEPKRTKAEQKKVDQVLEQIAADELCMTTLEERKWDRMDFQEFAVWSIKSALEAAYEAGKKSCQP